MRLKVTQQPVNVHKDIVTCVGWTPAYEMFTCSDDKTIRKWNMDGEPMAQLCNLDTFATDMHWHPAKKGSGNEIFALACTDGSFKLIAKNGKIEKSVEKAHIGAVTSVRWNYEGNSLLSSGEDGHLKVWSRQGMLRSTLLQTGICVYSIAWGPNNDHILIASGKELIIKPVTPSHKQLQWKAHDGTVLKVDWNPVNNLIVSGGEDCRYKVWDAFGRPLYSSRPADSIITSVAWCPDGEFFAVGCFNTLLLCDKTGWSYSRERTNTGSLFNLAWTTDGTQVAGAGGNGAVIFGHLVERRLEWQNVVATLDENNHIHVQDVTKEDIEELSFRDRVIKMSLGFAHLIVATSTQCAVYNTQTWATPITFDLKDTVNLITQSERHFITVDNFSGINVYNYEGRLLLNPKFGGLRTEFLNEQTTTASNDFLAILDRVDRKMIHIVDLTTGKSLETPVTHSQEIIEIFISQYGGAQHRKIGFIDKAHEVYISPIHKPKPTKIGTMVNSAMWNDKTDMLAAILDGKFTVWMYPNCAFFNKDLSAATKYEQDTSLELGKNAHIVSFFGKTCTVRKTDGALLTYSVSMYPLLLFEYCEKNDWERAVRLCRFVKDQHLWACLAAASVDWNVLNTAEVAFAAIEEVDKLELISYIKDIPSLEGRNAELYLFKGQIKEAEMLLLQAGLIYRAIRMNLRMFRWDRALELGLKHRQFLDIVLGNRQKFLEAWKKTETLPEYIKANQLGVEINWDIIKQKKEEEKQKEAARYNNQ